MKTMTIPSPTVGYGDRCSVLNYRCRPPRWEPGVVKDLAYKALFGPDFYWSYTVRLDRAYPFDLYVNSGAIRRRPGASS